MSKYSHGNPPKDGTVVGFFRMSMFGDTQEQNIARGALVGAFVGICIVGVGSYRRVS